MPLSHAVILYDAIVLGTLGLDFAAFSRRNDAIVPRLPLIVGLLMLAGLTTGLPDGRLEFVLLGAVVLGAAVFGYANFLAFVKRGVTFSILSNHTRPAGQRLDDEAFIAIDDRLHEMRDHGWAEQVDGRWRLTPAGRRVARVRQLLMRVLQIEAVG